MGQGVQFFNLHQFRQQEAPHSVCNALDL